MSPPGEHPPGFARQFRRLARPYWQSGDKWRVGGLILALVALTVAQVALMIWTNFWNGALFDALEQRSFDKVMIEVGIFAAILVGTIVVQPIHLMVKRQIQLDWRRRLTRRVLDDWMRAGRHYQLTYLPGEHDNPDGRIAEDIRNTTEVAVELAHSLLYCVLLFISFVSILWRLSGTITVTIGQRVVEIPGHMVFVAIAYAAIGSLVAIGVGRPLVRATDFRQTVEANFRFGLVRARENAEAIALIRGENDEKRRFVDLFHAIEQAWGRQTGSLSWIIVFTSGYGVLALVFPILVSAPRFVSGAITLGMLMQIAQAFQQITGALSWPVDTLARRAEWRASVERVLSLFQGLADLDQRLHHASAQSSIRIETWSEAAIMFDHLTVVDPANRPVVADFSVRIDLGERVLIDGDLTAAAKIVKVVAGLWPWGHGRVLMPRRAGIYFMPTRPYLPIGMLREAVSYPLPPDRCTDEVIARALAECGLGAWSARLDESGIWEQTLSNAEQQRLGFARLLLHRPGWIFLQEATTALDPDAEAELMAMLRRHFPAATIALIGSPERLMRFCDRRLSLSDTTVDAPTEPR